MVEIIDEYAAVDDEGDVLPLVDVYPGHDDSELKDMIAASTVEKLEIFRLKEKELCDERNADIDNARTAGNFRNRNRALREVANRAGLSNRDWGAAQLQSMDRGGHIKGSSEAAERSMQRQGQVKRMAEFACRVCPLAEWCQQEDVRKLVIDTMLQIGKGGQNARSRFINRVAGGASGDESLNNHFCETNLAVPRLRKDKA